MAATTVADRARADRAWDVVVVVVANAVVLLGLWVRHGGLDTLEGAGGPAVAAGQLTALFGTYAVLLELLSAERSAAQADGRSTESLDWQKALDSDMLALIKSGQVQQARERLQACLSSS